MKDIPKLIRRSKKIFNGTGREIYCLGVFSGYMICHLNQTNGTSDRTYRQLLKMIQAKTPVSEVVEFLEASIGK